MSDSSRPSRGTRVHFLLIIPFLIPLQSQSSDAHHPLPTTLSDEPSAALLSIFNISQLLFNSFDLAYSPADTVAQRASTRAKLNMTKVDPSTPYYRELISNHNSCSICLEDFSTSSNSESLSQMPCHHCFHDSCLTQWLNMAYKCPLCRYELETELEAADKETTSRAWILAACLSLWSGSTGFVHHIYSKFIAHNHEIVFSSTHQSLNNKL